MNKKISTSSILLIVGMVILLAGAILSMMGIEPEANYVLVAGALVIVFRGAVRQRERNDEKQTKD